VGLHVLVRGILDNYGLPGDFEPRNHDVNSFRKNLDGRVWHYFLEITTIRDLMDVKARKTFDEDCEKNPPELTIDNVLATLTSLMGQADVSRCSKLRGQNLDLLDHLVGAGKQRGWDDDAEGLGPSRREQHKSL